MKEQQTRQYTIRSVPAALDRALRRAARSQRKSLNRAALEALLRGAGLHGQEPAFTDLDHCIGSWQEDSAFDEALAGQDMVDRKQWR